MGFPYGCFLRPELCACLTAWHAEWAWRPNTYASAPSKLPQNVGYVGRYPQQQTRQRERHEKGSIDSEYVLLWIRTLEEFRRSAACRSSSGTSPMLHWSVFQTQWVPKYMYVRDDEPSRWIGCGEGR